MRRLWTVLLGLAAALVFGAAAYVIAHVDPVPDAGQIVGVSTPPSSSGIPSSSSIPTSAPPSSHPSRIAAPVVAFLGDDYTAGTGASAATARFSSLVSAALHLTERNFGVPGSGYAKSGAGGDYLSRVEQVAAAKPDVVVVSGGRNDIDDDLNTVAANARELFAMLRARLPHAVLVAVAPFWGDSPPRAALAQIATSVKAGVLEVGGSYLDISDPLLGHPEWMAGDADPNDAGNTAIAKAIEQRLAAKLPAHR